MSAHAPDFALDVTEFERNATRAYCGDYVMSAIPVTEMHRVDARYEARPPGQLQMYISRLIDTLRYTENAAVYELLIRNSEVVTFPLREGDRKKLLELTQTVWAAFIAMGVTPAMLAKFSFPEIARSAEKIEKLRSADLAECRRQLASRLYLEEKKYHSDED